jgi:eukaryotic-like serine/threonine-protein kinase
MARLSLRALQLGTPPPGRADEPRFVQDRLALLARMTFVISGTFFAAVAVVDLVSDSARHELAGRLSHGLATAVAFATWAVLRGPRRLSPAALSNVDLASTLVVCLGLLGTGTFAPQPYGFYTAMLAVTHVSIARAVLVPSLPWRTLILGAVCFAGFPVVRASLPTADAFGAGGGMIEAVLWSLSGVAVSALVSRVIYGLEERARVALQLGQYTLEEKIGEGGMGEVYRAHHAMLRRPTAIKLLLGNRTESTLQRFEREVQLTARLTHPNTISVYDYGRTPDGVFYYAMELLDGMTLETLVERHGPLPPGRAIHLVRQVCGALHEAHRAGLIHRDIKPANIIVGRRGEIADFVKVLDFGLVREVRADARTEGEQMVGTPLYMAPEAIERPGAVDPATDLYSLGVVAYFLVTGREPFHGPLVQVLIDHVQTPPPPPSTFAAVPADLEAVILSCLEKVPAARPRDAATLARRLEACAAAATWGEAEAEAWWNAVPNAVPSAVPSAVPAATPAGARAPAPARGHGTTVAVDLEARLALQRRRGDADN